MKHHSTYHITGHGCCVFPEMQKQTTEVIPQDTNAGPGWGPVNVLTSCFCFLFHCGLQEAAELCTWAATNYSV